MSIRIAVGKGSCGIAAGAQKVYDSLAQALSDSDISLDTVGCIGMCWLEPIVDIYENGILTERLVHVEPQHTKIIAEAVQSGDHAALASLRISEDDSRRATARSVGWCCARLYGQWKHRLHGGADRRGSGYCGRRDERDARLLDARRGARG